MSFFGRKEIAKLKKELETSNMKTNILNAEVAQLNENAAAICLSLIKLKERLKDIKRNNLL